MFVDEVGRVRIFHGLNAVYKTPPYHPITSEFDPLYSLSDQDVKNFVDWGFNIIRLGVLWAGVEPNHNQVNLTYIDVTKSIVDKLGRNNIYTMIDAHQDVWSRSLCGEGAPDWTVQLPANIKPFPFPVSQPYETENGIPKISDCISSPFWPYYYSSSVSYVFQSLYDNENNLQTEMIEFWSLLATHFKDFDSVLGYDLINEPWPGDIYSNPKLLQNRPHADKINLLPLYVNLTNAIRQVDKDTIILYEPMGTDYATPVGFDQLPDNSSALNYHVYCGLVNVTGVASNFSACIESWNNEMQIRMNDVIRLKTVGIMSEFGDMGDEKSSLALLEHYTDAADNWLQSTMYWQYKFYNDLTTQTPIEGLYKRDGSLNQQKLKVLSRTYAYAIAGTPIKMKFYPSSSWFILSLISNTTITDPTEIYLNEDIYYPNGFECEFSPEGWSTWGRISNKNYISINYTSKAENNKEILISIKKL